MAVVIFAGLTSWGCDDTDTDPRSNLFSPTPADSAPFVSLQPSVITAQTVSGGPCLAGQRFIVPLDLVFRLRRSRTLFLHTVRMQFGDPRDVLGASLLLRMPEIVSRFGSNEIPPFATRTFPLTLELGCLSVPTGTVSVFAETRDSDGRAETTTLHVGVR